MFRGLMNTEEGATTWTARITPGAVILARGMQKLLVRFGGAGLERALAAFEQFFGLAAIGVIRGGGRTRSDRALVN